MATMNAVFGELVTCERSAEVEPTKAACATREELEKERKVAAERESALLEKAASVAKGELEKELATARKAVKANSYCWVTKDVAREFEVHPKTTGNLEDLRGADAIVLGVKAHSLAPLAPQLRPLFGPDTIVVRGPRSKLALAPVPPDRSTASTL